MIKYLFVLLFLTFKLYANDNFHAFEYDALKSRRIDATFSIIFGGYALDQGLYIKSHKSLHKDESVADILILVGLARIIDGSVLMFTQSVFENDLSYLNDKNLIYEKVKNNLPITKRNQYLRASLVGVTALSHAVLAIRDSNEYEDSWWLSLMLGGISYFKFIKSTPEENFLESELWNNISVNIIPTPKEFIPYVGYSITF